MIDLMTLGEYALFGAIGLLGLRELRTILVHKMRNSTSRARIDNEDRTKFKGISSLIDNIDTIIDEEHKKRQEVFAQAGKEGLSHEQTAAILQPIDARLKQLEMVKRHRTWLQYVAPYADQIAEVALKWIKRSVT